jgi:DNA-binding transcriptional ArsR family regulator
MSEENNNSSTSEVTITEPNFSDYKDYKTIVEKLSLKDVPISATMYHLSLLFSDVLVRYKRVQLNLSMFSQLQEEKYIDW